MLEYDVLVVGAGAAGLCTAHALSVAGITVALVDSQEKCAPCFKAEKLEPDQIELLSKMNLMRFAEPVLSPIHEVVVYRGEKVVKNLHIEQFGMHYHAFVNSLRAGLPSSVATFTDTVTGLSITGETQTVKLHKGESLKARLVVISAGTSSRLRHSLGATRRELAARHTAAFGFDMQLAAGRLPHDGVNFIPDTMDDRVGFLTLFPTPAGVRANLFAYQDAQSDWCREMRTNTGAMLDKTFSGIRKIIGDYTVEGRVNGAQVELWTTESASQSGYVLVGDSFQSVCPATGTGLSKVLTDVDVLCELVPGWLVTPGMAADKLTGYYQSRRKHDSDQRSLDSAAYSRRMATDHSLRFRLTRLWRDFTGSRSRSPALMQ